MADSLTCKIVVCSTILVETSPQALPMGAACIASAIKSDEHTKDRCKVLLLDYSREEKNVSADYVAKSIINKAKEASGELAVFCASIYVWNRGYLEEVAKKLKEYSPSIVCMAGGPEATADPVHFQYFDFSVAGAGEKAVPLLVEAVLNGKADVGDEKEGFAFGIQGVYRINKNLSEHVECKSPLTGLKGAKAEKRNVVRAIPPLPSNLVSPYLDGTLNVSKYGGALWELARGCPFKCSYCYESKGEKAIQYFPLERLEKELDLFAEKNVAQVFVLDPTYNADKKRAMDMISLIAKKTPDTFYYFEARAEFIDKPLAKAFASIPCCLQIGLQSSDEAVLAKVHRTLNKKLFIKNIGYLNETGAIFGFDLIFGLPGDTLQGFERSIDFALSLYPNNLELFCLCVLPGTALYENGTELGLTWLTKPPYQVTESTTFPAKDIEKARSLARAVNLFYTQGRAVPWFMAMLYPLHMKASAFFKEFAAFIERKHLDKAGSTAAVASSGAVPEELPVEEIEKLQIDFVNLMYSKKHLEKLIPLAEDVIRMNGAIGQCTAEGKTSTVQLHYHPDDVMSEYATDFIYFVQNAQKMKSRVQIFPTSQGPDWKVLRK
ncbi:MAG: radical SAM protein [Treponema sp.]|nr:radical SAM protein [Treponema sp.]